MQNKLFLPKTTAIMENSLAKPVTSLTWQRLEGHEAWSESVWWEEVDIFNYLLTRLSAGFKLKLSFQWFYHTPVSRPRNGEKKISHKYMGDEDHHSNSFYISKLLIQTQIHWLFVLFYKTTFSIFVLVRILLENYHIIRKYEFLSISMSREQGSRSYTHNLIHKYSLLLSLKQKSFLDLAVKNSRGTLIYLFILKNLERVF